ncbi:SAM-dependent methyltransferase [Actinopolymorpha pittospori]|uniref:S-adenosyl-L-methionine-dependent methyltransferase n=1 Tax=Actinopolymorpha pittospori TaxID=648752 RepID=A0A927R7D2_9ACTN|nr:methyltransferase (TIGR00027 family) [Actinopolymorpha pittospori]
MKKQVAQTAVGPVALVAAEQYRPDHERLVRDVLAYQFLPTATRWVVASTRWRPMAELMVKATEARGRGLTASLLCRKRYVDDKLQEAFATGTEAVVILGAGLDTLAYRHAELSHLRVFEVDLPENIESKRARLTAVFGRVPDQVRLVPVDFDTQNLAEVLAAHGYEPTRKTFFSWEGVTQYLTDEGVRATFGALAKAASGSRLVFTYVRKDFLEGRCFYGAERAYQDFKIKRKLWRFGLTPEEVGSVLAEYGWTELEQMGAAEFDACYVKPTGRALSVSEIERSVHAEKL